MEQSVNNINNLSETALNLSQAAELASALKEYDAPEMYWGDNSDRSASFRRECAEEVRGRIDRRVRETGLHGFSIAISDDEYRVCVEALVQSGNEAGELIKHLRYFADGEG